MEGVFGLLMQLLSGGIGGNLAGAALKKYSLGPVGNSIAGIVGGGIGGQIVDALIAGAADSVLGHVLGGGVGGGVLMVIVGLVRQRMGGQKA